MSERLISALMLIAVVYGGVWSVLYQPRLLWVFVLLIFAAVVTVTAVWDAPVFESD